MGKEIKENGPEMVQAWKVSPYVERLYSLFLEQRPDGSATPAEVLDDLSVAFTYGGFDATERVEVPDDTRIIEGVVFENPGVIQELRERKLMPEMDLGKQVGGRDAE